MAVAFINLLKIAILTRLLHEETFGLYAITLMVIGFTLIFSDLGISTSLFHKQKIDQEEYSSLYWINILFNLLLYGLLLLVTPLVVRFYSEPQLYGVISIVGIGLILGALGKHFLVYAQKNFRFKELAFIDIFIHSLGLIVAIYLAYKGFEIYALVYSSIFVSLGLSIGYFLLMRNSFPLKLVMNFRKVKSFLSIGLYQSGAQILAFTAKEVDTIIIGRVLGMEILGIYNIIKQFTVRIYGIFNNIVSKVAIPVFSSFNDQEKLLKSRFLNLINKLSLLNAIIYSNLAIFSYLALLILFGEEYALYSIEFKMFCFYYFMNSIIAFCGILIISKGKTNLGFLWTIINLIINPGLIIILSSYYGMRGVLYAYMTFSLVSIPLYFALILRRVQNNISAKEFMKSFGINVILGLLIFAFGTGINLVFRLENIFLDYFLKIFIVLIINAVILYQFKQKEIVETYYTFIDSKTEYNLK